MNSPTPTPELVEAVARKMCEDDFKDPEAAMPISGAPNWRGYVLRAQSLIPLIAEAAAKIAEKHVGKAKRDRIARGWKMSRYQPHERDEIAAEENGGNIIAGDIAAAIRQHLAPEGDGR